MNISDPKIQILKIAICENMELGGEHWPKIG